MVTERVARVVRTHLEIIGERTTEALAAKRDREPDWQSGRPVEIDAETAKRIAAMSAAGLSRATIADTLNAEGVPTARGGVWHGSTVGRVLARQAVTS